MSSKAERRRRRQEEKREKQRQPITFALPIADDDAVRVNEIVEEMQGIADVPVQEPEPAPRVAARPKRAFRPRPYVMDEGVDVFVENADGAVEEDVYIESSSNRLLILTGAAARAARGGDVGVTRLRETESAPAGPQRKLSNADTFVSPSRIRNAPEVYPELENKPKPDRTLAQRRMLRGGMTVRTGQGEVNVDTGLDLETAAAGT